MGPPGTILGPPGFIQDPYNIWNTLNYSRPLGLFRIPRTNLRPQGLIWDPQNYLGPPGLFGTHWTILEPKVFFGTPVILGTPKIYLGPPGLIWYPQLYYGAPGLIWPPWTIWVLAWFLYQMVAHFTTRTHGVNQAFRFVEGIWLHRKICQIRFFFRKKTLFSPFVRNVK